MPDNERAWEILAGVRCFLLDMDGTFYLGDELIEGSLAFLDAVKRTGRTARFLTNNSSKSAAAYAEKLRRMGVPEEYRDVITSGHAAASDILRRFPGQKGFLMGNAALREELEGRGLRFTEGMDAAWVLAAFDTDLTWPRLCHVCDLLRAGVPFLATHPDINCATASGFGPDLGAMLALIQASCGRKPDLIYGKPHRGIVDECLRRTGGIPLGQMAMVGDRLYTDIATASRHGLTGILVLSGETRAEDIPASPEQPQLVFPRLSSMIPLL